MFKNRLFIMCEQKGDNLQKMQFSKNRKSFIFQEKPAIYSAHNCHVVLCIRTLSISILYVDRNTSRHGHNAASNNCDYSNDYSFYFYAVCMEETVRENEIGLAYFIQ